MGRALWVDPPTCGAEVFHLRPPPRAPVVTVGIPPIMPSFPSIPPVPAPDAAERRQETCHPWPGLAAPSRPVQSDSHLHG